MTQVTMTYQDLQFVVKYKFISAPTKWEYAKVDIHSVEWVDDSEDEEDRQMMNEWIAKKSDEIEEHFYEILTDQ